MALVPWAEPIRTASIAFTTRFWQGRDAFSFGASVASHCDHEQRLQQGLFPSFRGRSCPPGIHPLGDCDIGGTGAAEVSAAHAHGDHAIRIESSIRSDSISLRSAFVSY